MAVRRRWLDILFGPTISEAIAPPTLAISSPTFERHVGQLNLEEASAKSGKKQQGPQNLSLAWDDADAQGIPPEARRSGLLSDRDRKDTLYKAYCSNTWISACVDVIAKRFTSGGWEVEAVEQGKGDTNEQDMLKALLLYVNDDEDFLQFLRSIATDLLIFGEAYCEIVLDNAGMPAQLHKIDCLTMSYQLDPHGKVLAYTQTLDKSTQTVDLDPEQIIRWWFADPRASKKALSPIEHMKDAVYLYQAMTSWSIKFFKQGAKPSFSIEMGPDSNLDDAQRFLKFFKENYTGGSNAHLPPVMYNGSKLVEFGRGSIDVDFLNGLKLMREEILSAYGVPPALVGIIESGNIGGGSGEDQEKSFRFNTVDPIKQLILEKLNYRILKAFDITDWLISTRYADYRSDQAVAQVSDTHLRNGTLTINESRQTIGKMPLKGGDEAVIIAGKSIEPVSRLPELADEERQKSQIGIKSSEEQLKSQQQQNAAPPPGSPAPGGGQPPASSPSASSEPQEPKEAYLSSDAATRYTGPMMATPPFLRAFDIGGNQRTNR